MKRIVIVGGSLAGHHAAETLRTLGYQGELTVIGAEQHRPYDRYPLSKSFLTGRTDRQGLDLASEAPDVTWRTGQTATGLDLAERVVIVDRTTRIPFDGLVVASGADPRDASSVQGVRGAFVLRTVEDAVELRTTLASAARRVVVVGGGLIGAEIAAAAASDGHHTTLVHTSDTPTRHTLGRAVAEFVLGLHRAAGVHLRPLARARRLDVRADRVVGVHLSSLEWLPADIVVMATGTRANTRWLHKSGLDVSDGLVCHSTLHAVGDDRVVGAGDVARVPHPLIAGASARVEHWASTRHEAVLAAANLLAGPADAVSLSALPTFGTTLYGAHIRGTGFPQAADRSRVVWGSVESGEMVVVLGSGDQPVAAVSVNAAPRLAELQGQLQRGNSLDEFGT